MAKRSKDKDVDRDELLKRDMDERSEYQDMENDLPQLGKAPSWQSRGPRYQQYGHQTRPERKEKVKKDLEEGEAE